MHQLKRRPVGRILVLFVFAALVSFAFMNDASRSTTTDNPALVLTTTQSSSLLTAVDNNDLAPPGSVAQATISATKNDANDLSSTVSAITGGVANLAHIAGSGALDSKVAITDNGVNLATPAIDPFNLLSSSPAPGLIDSYRLANLNNNVCTTNTCGAANGPNYSAIAALTQNGAVTTDYHVNQVSGSGGTLVGLSDNAVPVSIALTAILLAVTCSVASWMTKRFGRNNRTNGDKKWGPHTTTSSGGRRDAPTTRVPLLT